MEIPERIWHLMAKALNKEASATEMQELNLLLEQDESVRQQFELLTRIWQEKGHGADDEGNARKLILRIIDRAETGQQMPDEEQPSFPRRRRRRLVAAGFILLALLTAGWWLFSSRLSSARAAKVPEALVVNKGSRSHYILPDGTTVWLNAGSKLYYENDFRGSTRIVRLEGEAFFDVVKDRTRPFIVRTSEFDIRVLGTAFNVRSYPEDKNIETTLYRGLVHVIRHNSRPDEAIQLKPHQKLILARKAAMSEGNLSLIPAGVSPELQTGFTITPIDSTKKESERLETAWLYSRLEFQGESFEDLALRLERWYNVRIFFTDEKVKKERVTGSFEKETIEQALAALKEGFSINYKITGDEIYIGSSE